MSDPAQPRRDPTPAEIERAYRRPEGPWASVSSRRTTYRWVRFNNRVSAVFIVLWFAFLAVFVVTAWLDGRARDGWFGVGMMAMGVGFVAFYWFIRSLISTFIRCLHGPDPDAS